MMMDDYKNSDNFQRTEGCKMISPHHFHPTNGVRPSDSSGHRTPCQTVVVAYGDAGYPPSYVVFRGKWKSDR
jgi:hypothetical protein